jgi:hypothetical protein
LAEIYRKELLFDNLDHIQSHVFIEKKNAIKPSVYAQETDNTPGNEFFPSTIIAPLNVLLSIQRKMAEKGNEWTRADVVIDRPGNFS